MRTRRPEVTTGDVASRIILTLSGGLLLSLVACGDGPTSPRPSPTADDAAAEPETGAAGPPVCGAPEVSRLVNRSGTELGRLTVSNTRDRLQVEFSTPEPRMRETQLSVTADRDGIPTNGAGQPVPGRFPNRAEHDPPVSEFAYELELDALGFERGQTVVIAAHADLGREGVWAEGFRIAERGNWATAFEFRIRRCAPTAVISSPSPDASIPAGDPLLFDGSESENPVDGPLTFDWDFGDGASGGVPTLPHIFGDAGEFVVTLTVTNRIGLSGSATRTVSVTPPPSPTGTAVVTGTVTDPEENPLSGVVVAARGGDASASTGADGVVELSGVPVGVPATLRLRLDGYVDGIVRLELPDGTEEASFRTVLRVAGEAAAVDAGAGGTATGEDGASLTLPPGALVAPGGAPVTGTARVALTPVDVSGAEVGAFPGEFRGVSGSGEEDLLVSFGAVNLSVTQNGGELQLAPGTTATLEIPVYTAGAALGDEIPLWVLDEDTGIWIQEGTGVVVPSGSPTGLALRTEVGHFSWWNIDAFPVIATGSTGCEDPARGAVACDFAARTVDDGPGYRTSPRIPSSGVDLSFPAGRALDVEAAASGCLATERIVTPLSGRFEIALLLECDGDGSDAEAVRLSYGDLLKGEIVGGVDEFVFAGESGDLARVDLSRGALSSLEGAYEIRDPSGSLLAEGTFGSSEAHVFLELNTTGDHTITVSGQTSADAGSYGIGLERFVEEDPVAIEVGGPALIGEIGFPVEVDRYTFEASAGEAVRLDVTVPTPSALEGSVELVDPAGTVLLSGSFDPALPARGTATLSADGTYTVKVRATTGMPDVYEVSVSVAVTGIDGALLDATIDPAGEVDSYTFEGDAGQLKRLFVGQAFRSSLEGVVSMTAPSGAAVPVGKFSREFGFFNDLESVTPVVELPESGDYTIEVDGDRNEPGAYRIGLGTGEGRLDPAFRGEGSFLLNGSTGEASLVQMITDPNGRVLTVSDGGVQVRRYLRDGALDTSFGSSGVVDLEVLGFFGTFNFNSPLTVQPDGKVVVVGVNGARDVLLVRLTTDGALDATFGSDGLVSVTLDETAALRLAGVVVLPDGDLFVVGGVRPVGSGELPVFARVNPDGSPDATLGGDGTLVRTDYPEAYSPVDVVLQTDDRVVTAGQTPATGGSRLAGFRTDGTLDPAFGSGGLGTEVADANYQGLTLAASGQLLAVGFGVATVTTTDDNMVVARYGSGGSLDGTFGNFGTRVLDLGYDDRALDVVVASDGTILLAGDSGGNAALARLTTGGNLDPAFGIGGIVLQDLDACRAAALQSDDELVLGCSGAIARFLLSAP